MNLLQVVTNSADTLHGSPVGPKSLSLLDLLMKGGWVMIPILLLLLMAVFIFIERYLTIKKASRVDRNFMSQIQDLVMSGNIQGARTVCRNSNMPVAKMLDKGLKKIGRPIDDIEKALESAGKLEVYKLEKNTSILGTIAGIAPMFGFLGTIAGVIKIFFNIAQSNDISINIISEGLYQKMITSAAGLAVGIFAHAGYHFLMLRTDREVIRLETNANEFIELLQEPTP